MMPSSDYSEAIHAAVRGSDKAFVVVWRAYNPMLLRFLRFMVDADEAPDLASAVWLDIIRRLSDFEGGESEFRAWLFTLARRRCIDHHRYRSRRPEDLRAGFNDGSLVSAGGPESDVDTRESTDSAIELIGTLPRSEAEVVLLRIVADLGVDAVAGIVGKRPGTVRVLCHRGLERLRRILAGQSGVATRELVMYANDRRRT